MFCSCCIFSLTHFPLGTSTQLEALQKIMQQVRNSDDSLTGASSDMGAGGGDDMPDTGPLPWTATGIIISACV